MNIAFVKRLKSMTPFIHAVVCAALCFLSVACHNVSSQELDQQHTTIEAQLPASLTDRPEQLLYRKAYVVSYNSDTRQANWVAWLLTAEHTDGDVPRPGAAWHDDPEVPEPRAYHYDYRETTWDRGHLCPAGDNKWDADAMYESFLMTNACPQHRALNSGLWNQIEQSCRQWAKKYGEIVIICGPLFLNQEHDTIGVHRIPVPEAFFKVVACLDPENPKGIGFICRNTDGNRRKDFYTNSISEVEHITGFTFFPNLDPELSSAIKSSSDISQW